jgi:fido (protein-threonine AMPylation protein)
MITSFIMREIHAIATEPILRKVDGQPFFTGPAIPAALDNIGAKLREGDCLRRGLPRAEFAEHAADIMAELNAIHPFREGNGRTQRVFMEQLAHAAGHDCENASNHDPTAKVTQSIDFVRKDEILTVIFRA